MLSPFRTSRTHSHHSRPRPYFSEELRSAIPRDEEFFFEQLTPEFTKSVIANVLSDLKALKWRASRKIWLANQHPKSFCKGVSKIHFCGWLSTATEEDLHKYAQFLSEMYGDLFSVECVLNARKLLIAEAKYRRIWLDLPRGLSVGPEAKNPLLPESVVETIQNRAMETIDVRRKVDALAKRLSRKCAKIMECRLVVDDENIETGELFSLLSAFIDGHVRSKKSWDSVRIRFPYKANGKYKDIGWAYFLSLVRMLRDRDGGREMLESLRSSTLSVRLDQPNNLEVRSFARALALAIRVELSDKGGEVLGNVLENHDDAEVAEISSAVPDAPKEEAIATETAPTMSTGPNANTFWFVPRKKPVTPDPDTVGWEKYSPTLPRTRLHVSKKDLEFAEFLKELVIVTKNGDHPLPLSEFSMDRQSELAWTFASYGRDILDHGHGEMVHERTGMRLAFDHSDKGPVVWAWTSLKDASGNPDVRIGMF